MISEIVSAISSLGGAAVSVLLIKHILGEYKSFKDEVRSSIKSLEAKIVTETKIISESAVKIEKSQIQNQSEIRTIVIHAHASANAARDAMKEVKETSSKILDIVRKLILATRVNEMEIKSVKQVVDDNHFFIKTKK